MKENENTCTQCPDVVCMTNLLGERVIFHPRGMKAEFPKDKIEDCPSRQTPEDADDIRNLGC